MKKILTALGLALIAIPILTAVLTLRPGLALNLPIFLAGTAMFVLGAGLVGYDNFGKKGKTEAKDI